MHGKWWIDAGITFFDTVAALMGASSPWQSRARAKNGDCHQFVPRHIPGNKVLGRKRIGWLYPIFRGPRFHHGLLVRSSWRRKSWPAWRCILVALLALGVGCSWFQADIEPLTSKEWATVVGAHRGRLLVVNVWAGWCRSCLDLFPFVVDLSNHYEVERLQVLSLSIDNSNDLAVLQQAREFLRGQDADFPHYLLTHEITRALEGLGLESIPAVMIYDAEGRLRYRLQGDDDEIELTPADVQDAVESLMENPLKPTAPNQP